MPKSYDPISIPTPLPEPLPSSLRNQLLALLVRENAIDPILQTLESECQKVGWQDAVRARIMDLLRNEEVGSLRELTDIIVREARGVDAEKGEGEGGIAKGGDGKEGGIRVPKKAVEEGTKIVREVVGRGGVVVEAEEVDFWG